MDTSFEKCKSHIYWAQVIAIVSSVNNINMILTELAYEQFIELWFIWKNQGKDLSLGGTKTPKKEGLLFLKNCCMTSHV